MIQTGQFSQFLHKTLDTINKENKEKIQWEFWLHRVFDQKYSDFCSSTETVQQGKPSKDELADAISFTMSMSEFDPEEGENL